MQIRAKATGYRSETGAIIVFADNFFSVLIMLVRFPYGDIWADVEMFCKIQKKFKMAAMKSLELYFH